MRDEQRQQVLDNARYLRQVRPVDPEEIFEYVEGQPHPATVRQVIREKALDLGLVERADGSFEPAPEGPATVSFHGVDALPVDYAMRLEDLLVEQFGPGWPDGESGDELRNRIRAFKDRYLQGEAVEYDTVTALGYGIYHLPAYYAVSQYVFADLAREGEVPASPRILDVGAGVGGPALGLFDLLDEDCLVDYHAVEPSGAAEVLDAMLEATGQNVHTTVHRETAGAFDPESSLDGEGAFDHVLFSNVLSELADPEAVVTRYLDALAPDGTAVLLAPADRNTATQLRDVERVVEERTGATVYAPTVRLWPGERPSGESWSFDVKPDLEVPGFQRRLDEGERAVADGEGSPGDGEFVNVDVQFAFSLLRPDGSRRIEYVPDGARLAKMADMDRQVTERIDCVAVKLSHDLSEGGNPLFLVGDGSQEIDHFAVLTDESALNRDLLEADYGDLLRFENVLVLWNDDEGAYNLVVQAETVVDRLPV
ncbi:small ribosomal subunit Rsm22 family protein [Halobacteriales archaeon Cl-PHB]